MSRHRGSRHVPRVLYHWRKLPESTASAGQAKPWALDAGRLALEDYVGRTGADAEVLPGGFPGVYRVKRRIRGAPLVSIVIPTAARYRTVRGGQVDMFDTIEHLFDPRSVLQAVANALTAYGVLVVSTPNFDAASRFVLGEP